MNPIAFLRKLAELQRAQIAHGHPVREYLWLASILPEMSLQVPEKKGASRVVDRVADGVARHKFWVSRRRALL